MFKFNASNINVPSGNFTNSISGALLNIDDAIKIDNNIISTFNNNSIILSPDGTGILNITSATMNIGSGSSSTLITTTTDTSNLILSTNNNSWSANIRINPGLNGNIIVAATGGGNVNLNVDTGNICLNANSIRVGNGASTTNIVTTTNTSNLLLSTNNNFTSSNIVIGAGSNGNIFLSSVGNGNINLSTSSNTAGNIFLNNTNIRIGNSSPTTNIITTSNTSNLRLATNNGTSSSSITINAGSNGSIIINPAGTGSLQRDSGGNNRGQYSNDLQVSRLINSQVCAGNYSLIGGGGDNAIAPSTNYAVIGGGSNNLIYLGSCNSIVGGNANWISGEYSIVCGGRDNIMYSSDSIIGGGLANSVYGGHYNAILCGSNNSISGQFNTILNGGNNNINGYDHVYIIGNQITATQSNTTYTQNIISHTGNFRAISIAPGYFSSVGDSKNNIFVLRCKTSGNPAGPTELALDGASSYISIPSGTILSGTANIIGSKSDGSSIARYYRQFTIKNDGTTALVDSVISLGTDVTNGTSISITANDTSDYLSITASGVNNETWRWVATVDAVNMTYGS